MSELGNLEPKAVFRWFEELCAIPHGSGHTREVADWCAAFAEKRGLEHYRDTSDNVIIIKPATPGYEKSEPVILQGHHDMVCVKDDDCATDLTKEGPHPVVDGEWVRAQGTSLGGDDGIAVAIALAILDADDLPHPRLEVVLTSDEEIGMLGAAALDVSPLRGRRMLNLDSEEDGVFTVGCAGGVTALCRLPLVREPAGREHAGTAACRIVIGGLAGGHSGEAIAQGLGNSNMLMGRLLDMLRITGRFRLAALAGGEKDNAIPSRTEAVIMAEAADADKLAAAALDFGAALKREYRAADPGLFVTAETDRAEHPGALTADDTARVIDFLLLVPNGLQEMSREIADLPQTSLNLGILRLTQHELTASLLVRSSVATQKTMLTRRLTALMSHLGGNVSFSGDYAAWEYRVDSPLRELLARLWREQAGSEPRVTAIHGGVECGIFSEKLPGLDCVSLGPDAKDIHTPRERMRIASVQCLWRLVTAALRECR